VTHIGSMYAIIDLHCTSRCHTDRSHRVSTDRNHPRNLRLIQWLLDGILRVLHKHLRLGRSRHRGISGCSRGICRGLACTHLGLSWSLTRWFHLTRLWNACHVFLTPFVNTLERALEALGHGFCGCLLTGTATGNPWFHLFHWELWGSNHVLLTIVVNGTRLELCLGLLLCILGWLLWRGWKRDSLLGMALCLKWYVDLLLLWLTILGGRCLRVLLLLLLH